MGIGLGTVFSIAEEYNPRERQDIMRVSGFSEFESIRKTVAKDDQSKKKTDKASVSERGTSARSSDQAQVSDQARMYRMRDKAMEELKTIPDPREEKIQEVLEKLDRGELMTPRAVKESIGRMIDQGITY